MDAGAKAQAIQRSHDLKATVYIPAVRALATGLQVVIKLADLNVPVQAALAGYHEHLVDLLTVHVVAELETADKFLKALHGLQELHQSLLPSRPFRADGRYEREEGIAWGRRCTADSRRRSRRWWQR